MNLKRNERNEQLAEELHKPSIGKFEKKEKYMNHLKTIFGALTLKICH